MAGRGKIKKDDHVRCPVLVHDKDQCVKDIKHVESSDVEEQNHECAGGIQRRGDGVGTLVAE